MVCILKSNFLMYSKGMHSNKISKECCDILVILFMSMKGIILAIYTGLNLYIFSMTSSKR
jgi:hypothetical protein